MSTSREKKDPKQPSLHIKELGKQQQNKPKVSKKKANNKEEGRNPWNTLETEMH